MVGTTGRRETTTRQEGYTTIELMAALALLALMVMIAGTAFNALFPGVKTDSDVASIHLMEKAGKLAHMDGLALSEGEQYTIAELVTNGYLALAVESEFRQDTNAVVKQSNGNFVYNGKPADPATDFVWIPIHEDTEIRIVDLAEHVTRTDIHIPAEIDELPVTEIGEASLANEGLTDIIIPDSVRVIADSALWGNDLESINVPDSVEAIGEAAFADNKIKKAKLPKGLNKVEAEVLASNGLVTVNIPQHVTEIAAHAFKSNALEAVTVPNPDAVIDDEAFDSEVSITRGR